MSFTYKVVCVNCRHRVTLSLTDETLTKLRSQLAIRERCPACSVPIELRLSQGSLLSSMSFSDPTDQDFSAVVDQRSQPPSISPAAIEQRPEPDDPGDDDSAPTVPLFDSLFGKVARSIAPRHSGPIESGDASKPPPFALLDSLVGAESKAASGWLAPFGRLPQWQQVGIILLLLAISVVILAWPTGRQSPFSAKNGQSEDQNSFSRTGEDDNQPEPDPPR